MTPPDLSINEWVVLAILAEAPAHGFAVAKELRADSDLGRILTVHRPLVYRALDRLVAHGLAEPHHTEPGAAGPNRTVHRLTRGGRGAVGSWLERPVDHVRELRIEFLIKLRLTQRADRDPGPLIAAQRSALAAPLDQLVQPRPNVDVVDLWRHYNAGAARAFIDHLALAAPPRRL